MVGFVKGKKPDLSGLKKIADSRNKGRPPAAIGGKGGGVTKKPVGTAKPVGGMPKVSGSKGSVAPMPSTGSSARRPNPRVVQKPVGKPNMPMVPSKLPAPRTNVTTGGSSKVAGASTSKPMLKRIGSLGGAIAKTMMKKGGAVKKAKPRSKK
jgi:hypothetical protein